MNSAPCRPQKLDALTSLRFFAAAMIVVGHAHPLFGSLGIASSAPFEQGVSFFFVLSGFILAYNYPSLDDRDAVKRFWLARFARIWPLHAVMLLLWIAVIFNFDRQSSFPGVDGLAMLVANVLLLQAWVPLHSWALSFNEVAWSLSAEFFFYAIFPFLVRRWQTSWHWMLLLQVGVLMTAVAISKVLELPGTDTHSGVGLLGVVNFNPLVRMLEFSAGIAVAFIVKKIGSHVLTLSREQWFVLELTVLGACFFALLAASNLSGIQRVFGEAAAYYFTREGLWLLFAVLIGVFALSQGPATKLLSVRPLGFFGEISFALYLCHAMIIHYLEPHGMQLRAAGAVAYILFWIAALGLSVLLFYGVEQPARAMILNKSRGADHAMVSFVGSSGNARRLAIGLVSLITVAASAMLLRPSMVEPLDEASVERFLTTPGTHLMAGGGHFSTSGMGYSHLTWSR